MKTIKPVERFEGEFDLPGDKSITHRAIMLNGGAEGEAVITNALMGGDCLSTCQCMRALGAEIEIDGTTLRVRGTPHFRTGVNLNCGNSGTTMRLLIGFAAGKGIEAKLVGDESLSSRPMERVALPLSHLGADVRTSAGPCARIRISRASARRRRYAPRRFRAGKERGPSGGTLRGGGNPRDRTAEIPRPYGTHALRHGRGHFRGRLTVRVKKSRLKAADVCVPADISSAAYFMALGVLKGKTLSKNVGLNPTRTGILRAFDKLGVKYTALNRRLSGGEETADILVEKSPLRGIALTAEEIPAMIDELPLIALLCAFADGESRISGARELRLKESDRIRTTSEMIAALGGICIETEDGFVIRGRKTLPGGNVESYLDHRIAMTAAVGLMASERGGNIDKPECCAISFPGFFELLEQ